MIAFHRVVVRTVRAGDADVATTAGAFPLSQLRQALAGARDVVELQQIDLFGPKTLQGSLEFIRARLRRPNLDFRCNEYLVPGVARANDIADYAFCVAINRRRID
jgi:hypothetical protein